MLQLEVIGNLGTDADIRSINNREYISFRMASTARFKDKTETTWVNVLYRRSDALLPYLTRGAQVYVCGECNISTWTNRDGQTSVDIRVWASNLTLVGKRTNDDTTGAQAENNGQINGEETPF